MTNLVDFSASSALPPKSGEDPPARRLAMAPSVSEVPPNSGGDVPTNMWFYSQARERLDPSHQTKEMDTRYGVAAQVVCERVKSRGMTRRKTWEFEVEDPAAMSAMIAATRQQGRAHPPTRGLSAPASSGNAHRASIGTHRSEEFSLAERKYRARLEKELESCSILRSTPAANTKTTREHQPPASHATAGNLPCVGTPVARGSGRRGQSLRCRTSLLQATRLAKEWVHEEERAAAETTRRPSETYQEKLLASMPYSCPYASCAGNSSRSSCGSRLRKSTFPSSFFRTAPTHSDVASPPEGTDEEMTVHPPWRQRLLAEPIQSYRILRDAVMDPVKPNSTPTTALRDSVRIRRNNLEKLRHSFENQRFKLHGELEDNLEWRDRCRRAVMLQKRRADETTASLPSSSQKSHSTHKYLEVSMMSTSLLTEVFGGGAPLTTRGPQGLKSSSMSSSGLFGVWTEEAARQAVQQEKSRLVALLQSFVVTCSASTLTLAAMEDLRADTVRQVLKSANPVGTHHFSLLYREDFLEFLRVRYELPTTSLLGLSSQTSSADIIDALPSEAEASFARYTYDLLPSRAKPLS